MPKTAQQNKKKALIDDQTSVLNEDFDLEIDFSLPLPSPEEPPKRTRSSKSSSKRKDSAKSASKRAKTPKGSKKTKPKESKERLEFQPESYGSDSSRIVGKDPLDLFDQLNSDLMPESEFFPDPISSTDLPSSTNLLVDLWEDDPMESEREKQRMKDFYEQSIENTHKRFNRQEDDSVVRKIQVGLYESDAALLEELFQQSKRAGLPNVSRARILRVALRHFHTCWLNQDPS